MWQFYKGAPDAAGVARLAEVKGRLHTWLWRIWLQGLVSEVANQKRKIFKPKTWTD